MTETFLAQIGDPFRIILLVALFATMLRTRAQTGTWIPLAAGAVFVAVLIPLTVSQAPAAELPRLIGLGLVVNAIWLAVITLGWQLWQRLRQNRS